MGGPSAAERRPWREYTVEAAEASALASLDEVGIIFVKVEEPKSERAQLRGSSGSSHIAATAAIEVEAEAAAARAATTGGKQTIALTSVAWAGGVDVACQLLPSMPQYRHPDETIVSPVEKTTEERARVLHKRTSGGDEKGQSPSPDPPAPCKPPSYAHGDQGAPGVTCLPSQMHAHTARKPRMTYSHSKGLQMIPGTLQRQGLADGAPRSFCAVEPADSEGAGAERLGRFERVVSNSCAVHVFRQAPLKNTSRF